VRAELGPGTETTESHASKLIAVEKQLIVLIESKCGLEKFVALEKEFIAAKRDLHHLTDWKRGLKEEKTETARRRWAFGPNITAAIIGGFITLLGVALNVGLTYLLTRKE
jgi:hypothetical protein